MEIVDYGPLWETMKRNNVTQYQLLQSGIDNHTLDSLKRVEISPCSHWRSCARSSAVLQTMLYLSNSGCWHLGRWSLLLYKKKKRADSYTAIRPSEIILLS